MRIGTYESGQQAQVDPTPSLCCGCASLGDFRSFPVKILLVPRLTEAFASLHLTLLTRALRHLAVRAFG